MTKVKEIFYDEKGKELDLSGPALRKQDALEAKKSKAKKSKSKKGSSKAKRGPGGRFVKAIKKVTSRKKK